MLRLSNEDLLFGLFYITSLCSILSWGINVIYKDFPAIYFLFPLLISVSFMGYILALKQTQLLIFPLSVLSLYALSLISNVKNVEYLINGDSFKDVVLSDGFLILAIHVPAIIIAFSKINIEKFSEKMAHYSKYVIYLFVFFFFISLITGEQISYMDISYAIIPFICYFIIDRNQKNKSTRNLVLFLSIICICLLGCRGAILNLIFFLFLTSYCKSNIFHSRRKFISLLLISLVIIALVFFYKELFSVIKTILDDFDFESRLINMIIENTEDGILHYDDRAFLIGKVVDSFSLFGNGIYGDRLIINTYSHNVFIELMSAFGVMLGGLLCAGLLCFIFFLIYILYIENNVHIRFVCALVISFLMVKYCFSSSFLHSHEFWLLIGLGYNIIRRKFAT